MELIMFKKFPNITQHDQMDCGPACLAMISKYYGKNYSIQELREYTSLAKDGVSLLGIEDGAREIGFDTVAVEISTNDLIEKEPLPCILHWNQNHFVILYKISKSLIFNKYYFYISDPAFGRIKLNQKEFERIWSNNNQKGLALLLEPNEDFILKEPRYINKFTFKKDALN